MKSIILLALVAVAAAGHHGTVNSMQQVGDGGGFEKVLVGFWTVFCQDLVEILFRFWGVFCRDCIMNLL